MKKGPIIASSIIVVIIVVVGVWYFVPRRATSPEGRTPAIGATFSCNQGKMVKALFYKGETVPQMAPGEPPVPGGSVLLALSDGRTMTLHQTISADGGRYANSDESFVFWNKGNGALVQENGMEKDYTGCIVVAPESASSNLTKVYSDGVNGFSIRTPEGYVADSSYRYSMDPTTTINGVKFTIPAAIADGTNLGHDTYLSVESLPQLDSCSASLFLYDKNPAVEITENGTTYSVASSTGAGVGNRYEETVYAIPGSNPCRAVRYFVHYSIIENYPVGSVVEFNKQALLKQFNQIRSTLTLK